MWLRGSLGDAAEKRLTWQGGNRKDMGMGKELYVNFFPLKDGRISVVCYRRACLSDNEGCPDKEHYRFSEDRSIASSKKWWLVSDCRRGYEKFTFVADKEPMAARWILSRQILRQLERNIASENGYQASFEDGHTPRLVVKVRERGSLGWQGFLLEFDWHGELHKHGLYINYHFFKNEGVPFDEKIQQLSFSLDEFGKPNCNFYRNHFDWIRAFYEKFLNARSWCLGDETARVEFGCLAELPAVVLNGKTFEFADGGENKSPYWGLKKSGPYRNCKEPPTYFFVFKEEQRQTARFLYNCLCGREYPERFPGMLQFFGVQFGNANVRHIILNGETPADYAAAAEQIAASKCRNPVAVVLVPGDSKSYLVQKSAFLARGIPSQDVQIGKARAGRSFQWSVAGVALQLFCKSGGIPWCVRTPRKRDLIIGVSQLWRREDRKRFVAYSVTTDASGLFRDIRTLSDKTDEHDYVQELSRRIKEQLQERIEKEHPDRIVLHCSFRLLKSAMIEIRKVVGEVLETIGHSTQIVILRVNTEHHYQGFDPVRETMVPDENTVLKIRRGAYLIWPDGTPPGGISNTRPSGPVFVAFDRADPPLSEVVERDMLQDLCNLSGANWRGFNAKARPVSVFYCSLVGRMMSDMDELGLELPAIERFVPWFL